jgi:hypothetical protein
MRGRFLAAVKACGPGAALSHRSAAALWNLLAWGEDDVPEVTVSTSHGRKIPGIVVHRTRVPFKSVPFDAIPVVTAARPLIGVSSVLPFDPLRRAVREAMALKRVTVRELVGGQWHDHPLAHEDDAERQSRLEAADQRVIRVSWKPATFSPDQTIARRKAAGAPSRSGEQP